MFLILLPLYLTKIILVDTFFGSFGDPNIIMATKTAPYDSASETLSWGLGFRANTRYKHGGMMTKKIAVAIQAIFDLNKLPAFSVF